MLAHTSAVFESELWPGEGRPVIVATAERLTLHEEPTTSAPIVGELTVSPGQIIRFDAARYRTLRSGRVRAWRAASVIGRDLGPISYLAWNQYYRSLFPLETRRVEADETIELLQYHAEGTCFVRASGHVLDTNPCPTRDAESFRLELEPLVEWWIHVANDGLTGWVLVSGDALRVVDREY
jgi:hypothetical protein